MGLSGCFALTPCPRTLSPRFVGYASSPHFVPTPCRIRFVSTLRPYALSKAAGGRRPFAKQPSCIAEEGKRVGSVRFSLGLAFSSLQMRTGARGLRGELGSAWDSERPAGDGWRFKCGIMCGIKCVLRTNTLSPHLVSTLCRIRFVSALCPYALSEAKEQAAAVSQAGRQ